MKIMLDKERDFNLTVRGVVEYEKLGYGRVSDITDKSSNKLIQLVRQIGDEGFKEFLDLREQQKNLSELEFQEKTVAFLTKYQIDMNTVRDPFSAEQAIALLRIGLGLKDEDETYDILDKASKNPESDVTVDNFPDVVYKLLLDSRSAELEKSAEKVVPLDESQAPTK